MYFHYAQLAILAYLSIQSFATGIINNIAKTVVGILNSITNSSKYTTANATIGDCRNIKRNNMIGADFCRYQGVYGDVLLSFILVINRANIVIKQKLDDRSAPKLHFYGLSGQKKFVSICSDCMHNERPFLACCAGDDPEGIFVTMAYVKAAQEKGLPFADMLISVPTSGGRALKDGDAFLEWAEAQPEKFTSE
jgi:hypothetical protein